MNNNYHRAIWQNPADNPMVDIKGTKFDNGWRETPPACYLIPGLLVSNRKFPAPNFAWMVIVLPLPVRE